MTVKEVMEKLKTCNPKAQVHFRNTFTSFDGCEYYTESELEEISLVTEKDNKVVLE